MVFRPPTIVDEEPDKSTIDAGVVNTGADRHTINNAHEPLRPMHVVVPGAVGG